MIVALLLSAAWALDVRDYFPTATGTVWTYETLAEGTSITSKMTAGAPAAVDGAEAIPFVTTVLKQTVETIYYRLSEDTVSVVAYDPAHPFSEPRPVLKIGPKGMKWVCKTDEQGMPLTMECSTAFKPARKFLDRDVEVLELKVKATMGFPDSTPLEMNQVAIYGKGIGLIEVNEERKAGRRKEKRQIRLVKFEPAVSEGGA